MAIANLRGSGAWLLCLLMVAAAPDRAAAQPTCEVQAREETSIDRGQSSVPRSAADLRQRAAAVLADKDRATDAQVRARLACVAAEILKRLGDVRAETLYDEAVQLAPTNAQYRLLFADYYRNYRGPGQPLIGDAARHYYVALQTDDTAIRGRVHRSLIALYERDGLPLSGRLDGSRPWLFFSTQNTGGISPDDPGAVDGIRLRTSAALLAQSDRLRRPLTTTEFGLLIRNNWRGQTLQRLRARVGSAALDGYFEGHMALSAQPINFGDLGSSVDSSIAHGGIGVEHVASLYPAFDLLVRGDIKWGSRSGLVEFLPDETESTRLVVGKAIASRFVGPDKINFEVTVARDDITPPQPSTLERSQKVFGVTARYQVYRPLLGSRPYERPIASRGSEVFAGWARQTERFGDVDVDKTDVFFGAALKGLPGGGSRSFDVTVQPTVFSFERQTRIAGVSVTPLTNRQLDTTVTVLYRVIDRENDPRIEALSPLVFLNVVGLFSTAHAKEGLPAFERTRIGAQLDAKFVGRQHGGVTWLASARYELQESPALERRENVVGGTLSMGF